MESPNPFTSSLIDTQYPELFLAFMAVHLHNWELLYCYTRHHRWIWYNLKYNLREDVTCEIAVASKIFLILIRFIETNF